MLKFVWELLPLFLMILLYGAGSLGLIHVKTFDPVGAANYPLFLTIAAAVLSVPLAIEFVAKARKQKNAPAPDIRLPATRALSIIGLTVTYLYLLSSIGFIPLTPVYVGTMLWAMGTRSAKTLIVTAVGTTLVLWLVFGVFFGVLLPSGLPAQ